MIIKVNPKTCEIDEKIQINSGEYNVNKCQFEFSEEYTSDLVKKALFTDESGIAYEMVIYNNQCDIPSEILAKSQNVLIGVYAYKIEESTLILRYSPMPFKKFINKGSYVEDTTSPTTPTPSEAEQYYQAMQDLIARAEMADINISKSGITTTITVTHPNGTTHSENVYDSTIEVGNVNTTMLPESSSAEVDITNSGTTGSAIFDFDFKIPKGDTGRSATIELGNVETITGEPETEANVDIENTGTENDAIFDFSFTIPKGEKGDCSFATFDIIDGDLIMNKPDTLTDINFSLINGFLEVEIDG